MNFSPNNVYLANNQQFGQNFDVKNIFRPYPLITDRNLHPLTKSVNRRLQEELLVFSGNFRPPAKFNASTTK